jgi:hypothetical protein
MRQMWLAMSCVMVAAAVTPAHADGPKSEQTAQIMSGVGTGVSSALILAAFLDENADQPFNKPLMYTGLATAAVTPSLGQFYAGEYFTIGMAARVVGAGLATYALTHYTKISTCDDATMAGSMCKVLDSGAYPLLGLAAIAFVGGMAYDVGDAAPAVHRWNERHNVAIAPTAVPGPNGPAAGLSVFGQF